MNKESTWKTKANKLWKYKLANSDIKYKSKAGQPVLLVMKLYYLR